MASSPTRLTLDQRKARTCPSQKVGHATKADAALVAERMMDLGQVDPGCHVTPYQCLDCLEWHVYNRVIVPLGKLAAKRAATLRKRKGTT